MPEKKYTLTQIIVAISAAVGMLTGGGGYFVGASTAKQSEDPTDPKKQFATCSLDDLKKSLDSNSRLLSVVKDSVFSLGIEQRHIKESAAKTEASVNRLSEHVQKINYKFGIGFACESMASGSVAIRKIN